MTADYFTEGGSNTPTSTKAILTRTFQIYITNIWPISKIACVTIPPAQILMYITAKVLQNNPQITNYEEHGTDHISILLVMFLIVLYLGIFFYTVTAAATIHVAVNAHAGETNSFADAMTTAKRCICTVCLTNILVLFASNIGLAFFILPGIYLMLAWLLTSPIIVLEQRGICDSMYRSWSLTAGNRWNLFKAFGAFMSAFFLFLFAINFTFALFANRVVAYIVGYCLPFLSFLPLIYILQTVLYFDLRARKESYDRIQLVSELSNNKALLLPTQQPPIDNIPPDITTLPNKNDNNEEPSWVDQEVDDLPKKKKDESAPFWAQEEKERDVAQKYNDFALC